MLTAELTVYLLPVTIFCILYSAFLHPRETHKVLYGLVYLFMFPTMFILLPLYSIANIVDQSWGTRDGNKTHIPKLSCMPSLKKFLRRKKKHREDGGIDEDTETEIQNFVRKLVTTTNSDMSTKADFQHEATFWESLVSQSIGTSVNLGLDKADLAKGLRSLRNGTLFGLLALNAAWIGFTSWIYVGGSNQQAQLLVFSIIAIAMFGLSVAIQLLGVTMSRVEQVVTRLARWCSRVDGERTPLWIFHRQGQEPMREA